MHNNIMAAGSRDRPLMLAPGRYPQWRSRFLRYVDTRPNGEALRKCILSGPYKPTTMLVHAVKATDNSPAVAEHTTVETPTNMSPENKAYFLAEKGAIYLILTGIGDDIYSTVDAYQTAQEMSTFNFFNNFSRNGQVNELRAEKLARNANPLALVATAQASQDPYYQSSRSHRSSAPSPKPLISSKSHTATRHKGKEIEKPITPPSETASEEDSDPEQAQRDKDMQKNLALIAKYFKKIYKPTNNNLRTSLNSKNKNVDMTLRKPKRVKDYHKEKMLLCKQAEQGVPLQAEQYDWLADTDKEVDEQELEAHYSYMAKIQEVPTADSSTDSEPVEQVQYKAGYNVFANHIQNSEQSKSVSNTCSVETDDSNVIPDSPDICEDDIQNEQNDVESDDEHIALANLIANLKLDVDENKKIQKQLKKANTTLSQELKECKTILAETSKSLGESISVRDSCLVALQIKHAEFEKFKAFNDCTINYEKLERKLNDALGQLAHKDTVIRERLKTKAYELSVVKEKHDELMKQRLLTKSHYEGLVKQKIKAQSEIPCLYAFPYDQNSHANRLIPNGEETLALERESQSKLNKDSGDSLKFVHELKQEIHADLKYVESLEKEIDELESEKAEFSDMYDVILHDCVSKDVMCSYLQSLSNLDALAELQCMYLHKVKECDCLAQRLSKQTESVSKKIHTELLQRFAKLEKHSISLKIGLQKGKEQTLPHTTKKAVSNTNVLKPGMYRIDNRTAHTRAPQSPHTVKNTNPRVSTSTRVNHNTNVSRPQLKSNQLKDKVLPNNSQVKAKKTQVEVHPRIPSISNKMKYVTACKDSLNSKTLNANAVCATCNKCLVVSNHFACVTKMLNNMHARTKKPTVVPISTRKPKSQVNKSIVTPNKKKVASKTTKQKQQSYFSVLYENTNKTWKWWIERQSPSGYKWVPKTKKQWVPKAKMQWVPKAKNDQIVQLILFIVDSRCTKHMTGNLKLLCNFVEKFLGTVRFGNDQFAPILGYRDLVQGNDETPKMLKDFLTMIQRNLQALVIAVRTDRGTEFLNKTLNAFFKEEGIEHQTYTARTPEQNGVVERRNRLVPQRQKASNYDNPDPVPQRQDVYSSTDTHVPSQQELDLLFGPLYDEFFNAGNVMINTVYYIEGLNHNLFSVGQFCDVDSEVAFRKSTCFVKDLHGSNPSTNIQSTSAPSTHTNVHAEENNNDQAEEGEQLQDDEF
nr:integrase, catalytic region, zinc finger, CCHC-type, peptidase aspartic, catalytic [Tanacetum cinerariifolium]